MRSNRGAIPVVVYFVLAGFGLVAAVPNWRPQNWFPKDPPTKELLAAQADLERVKAEAKLAQDALNAVKQAEESRKREQSIFGQEMAHGAEVALKTAPESPQVALAKSLLARANPALVLALGELPADKRNEILLIVSQSLSGAADQLAQANATLALRDKELAVATAERETLKARLPSLESAVEAKSQEVATQTLKISQKTQEVVTYAEKLAAEKQQSGSLGALVGNLWRTVEIMGVLTALGFGVAWWLKHKFSGFPQAMAAGISELRANGAIPPQGESNVFDAFLDRHEQSQIVKHL